MGVPAEYGGTVADPRPVAPGRGAPVGAPARPAIPGDSTGPAPSSGGDVSVASWDASGIGSGGEV